MAFANGNAVAVVYGCLEKLIKPLMDVTKEWGDLLKTAMGLEIKKDFEGDFQSFVDFFHSNSFNFDLMCHLLINFQQRKLI